MDRPNEMASITTRRNASAGPALPRPNASVPQPHWKNAACPTYALTEAASADYVVAVNPGCQRQLRQGLRRRKSKVRAVHIADLLRLAARDR
jgi:Fe-S oxidoreductase